MLLTQQTTKMEVSDLGGYTDAIACLRQTLVEGRKASNVDIQLMLSNIQRCETIVQQLVLMEQDAFNSAALTCLAGSLSAHAGILDRKIKQLNESRQSDIHIPNYPESLTLACSQGLSSLDQKCASSMEDEFERKQSKSRQQVIESTIVRRGQVKFNDVIGLTEAKLSLQEAIIMPLVFPHLFSGGRKPWRRILLFGPPGTGKSRLAQAVSTEVRATFYSVSSTDLISSWVGESEKLIKELFHHASNQHGQSVIFIDEIDSLCRHRSPQEDESTRRMKTELLIQLDGADRNNEEKIFLLCATNCPWDLDAAFLRRFQKRIYITLPDHNSRIELMKLHCHGSKVDMSEADWERLASQTDGFSGSDLSTLTNGALFQPVRELQTATHWIQASDGKWLPADAMNKQAIQTRISDLPPEKICPRDVTIKDFQASMKIHGPTVSESELQKFSHFTLCFGQIG